jgi:ligand-binding SRPBCC domain-containing protein
MRFRHQFTVHAPRAKVVQFHAQATSMAAITPPPVRIRFRSAPALLSEGDSICFTLGVGPIALPWRASIDLLTPEAFADRQVAGPFRGWVHRHSFNELSPGLTEVEDWVEAAIPLHLLWTPVALGIWLSLPLLFAYRGWKTRLLLETGL